MASVVCRAKLIQKIQNVAHARTITRQGTHPASANPAVHLVFQAIDDGGDHLDAVGLIELLVLKTVADTFVVGNTYTVSVS